MDDSRQARTAAEAAALAAAGEWSGSVESGYYDALGSTEASRGFVRRQVSRGRAEFGPRGHPHRTQRLFDGQWV